MLSTSAEVMGGMNSILELKEKILIELLDVFIAILFSSKLKRHYGLFEDKPLPKGCIPKHLVDNPMQVKSAKESIQESTEVGLPAFLIRETHDPNPKSPAGP